MVLLARQALHFSATVPKIKMASRPGAAPGKLSFGDSAAQAGARLKTEIGAAAASCTRTSSVAGRHSAVKSQPRKIKGPEVSLHSRPAPFQQRTNTSCYLAIPTRGFTAVLSVFRGTPPAKPLDCKIRPNSFGAVFCDPWTESTGGEPRLSRAFLCFVPGDII